MKSGHGGSRPGAGRKAGGQNAATVKATVEKEVLREHIRARVASELDPMLDAQIDNAKGLKHLMMRDPKTGKFERVATDSTDPQAAAAQIDAALTSGNAFWIYTKDPSIAAWTDLANRTVDKPKEQEQEINLTGDQALISALMAGRQRALQAKR